MTPNEINAIYSAFCADPKTHETVFYEAVRKVALQQIYVYGYQQQEIDREAIAQEVAISVFQALPLQLTSEFSWWILTVIKNRTVDHIRARDRRHRLEDLDIPLSFDESNPDHWERLKEAVGPQNEQLLKLLILGHSFEEAGEQLGITGTAARNRIQRIKNRVQKESVTK